MSTPSIYTGLIAEAGRDTSHSGLPAGASPGDYHTAEGINPVCGDRVSWYFKVKDRIITEIRYEAKGCLMNKASAAFLARFAEGLDIDDARQIKKKIDEITDSPKGDGVSGEFSADKLEAKPWLSLAQIRDFPARRKCVMMAWDSFFSALDKDTEG
ncbi:MAG: iron-sulfur cluster assembly scaffold protein [Balneolia bacterium]|nr:iron-sulfur cluster assembly scaffold protein [Balneolia bacterium]